MAQKIQIKRTETPNSPPSGLQPGELAVEMAKPTRLWVGVSAAQDATLKKLLIDASNLHEHGRCMLVKSGSNLMLKPFGGNKLMINGATETIPDAGVFLVPVGTTINVTNYIYAFMNGATLTLEASVTGHGRDAVTGVEIKTGDATRTLVGIVRPEAGPVFVDTDRKRFVRTWFNDNGVKTISVAPAASQTTSATSVKLNANWNIRMLMWDNEIYDVISAGSANVDNNGYGVINDISVLFDSVAFPTEALLNICRLDSYYGKTYTVALRRACVGDKMGEFHPAGFISNTGTGTTGYWWDANFLSATITGTTKGRR